jgi:guanylate kinase
MVFFCYSENMPKIIILAPSAGGKSTLMRYLREHTKLNVREMDEE